MRDIPQYLPPVAIGEVMRRRAAHDHCELRQATARTSTTCSRRALRISLRGLGQKSTLVLINGRRAPNYGFAQNLSDTYFDLNSLPASAIERVEVLKDGASALYGSDAVAGVVNVIINQLRIAETEKYAHVTFFSRVVAKRFFANEKRILIQSPKVATYDLQPEMSAFLVKDAIVEEPKEANKRFHLFESRQWYWK